MKKDMKIYRLMNHDNLCSQEAKFKKYSLKELNEQFGTNYKSIEEAIDTDPEYLFSEKEMQEFINKKINN